MSKLDIRTPDSTKKADEQYAPYPQGDTARNLRDQENSNDIPGYDRENDGLDDHPITAGDASGKSGDLGESNPSENINKAQKKENDGGSWANKVTNDAPKGKSNFNTKVKGLAKKKGPMALIMSLLFGGGAGLTLIFSPGVAIVQLKEILVGDLNDQVRAMSVFDEHLMRSKLKKMGTGVCTSKVSIRCKFNTMSKREAENFKKAGFKLEPDEPNKVFGRTKPTKITFPDGTVVNNPAELTRHINGSIVGRAAVLRAFNPKFAGLADKVSSGVFARLHTSKTQKVSAGSKEEQIAQVTEAVAGDKVDMDLKAVKTDAEGREYVTNESGQSVYKEKPETGSLPEGAIVDEAQFSSIQEINQGKIDDLDSKVDGAASVDGGKAVGGVLKSGLKGISILGAADTACTVWNTARAVSAAAKATRAIQLAQYAMVFFNVADRIKAGVATPEEVEYIGDTVTDIDTREKIPSDSEPDKMVDNPYYGASGFDSPGYKTAAYNEAPLLQASDTQYMVGGALAGKLASVLDTIGSVLGGKKNIRSTCKVVQSWWARGLGLIAGLASAIGSFGTSTAISIGVSITIGFAMPFLEAALADIIAGKVVSGKTKGVDSTNAAFSGGGALLGAMAGSHGMPPGGKKDLKSYLASTDDLNRQLIAAETYEAQKTPLDINNQYSFLGSAVRKVNPLVIKSTASISAAITNIPSMLGVAASSIIPTTKANPGFNEERYNKCPDQGYEDLDIDADIFCNVRYFMSPEQMAIEPDAAAEWMLSHGHIEEDGSPKSDDYKDWIKYCTEREDGWGETSEDDDNSDKAMGLSCVNKSKNAEERERLKYFPPYYMSYQLQDTKDNGYESSEKTAPASSTVVSPVTVAPSLSSGYGPRGPIAGAPNASKWHAGIDMNATPKDVVAIMDGTVVSVGGAANTVVIKHADGLKSQYLHMEPATVKQGDIVKAGQKIGTIGCAGQAQGICSGAHLHFNIWVDEVTDKSIYSKYKVAPAEAGNSAGKAINPANFLTDKGVKGFEEGVNDN